MVEVKGAAVAELRTLVREAEGEYVDLVRAAGRPEKLSSVGFDEEDPVRTHGFMATEVTLKKDTAGDAARLATFLARLTHFEECALDVLRRSACL